MQRFMVKSNRYGRAGHHNLMEVRRCELLPNGKWRVDYVSGLVELFDREPTYAQYHPYRETMP